MANRALRSSASPAARLAAALALTLALVSGWVAWREWQVEDLVRAMHGADGERREALARYDDVMPSALPDRAAAALAQCALASAVATAAPGLRGLWLERARLLVGALARNRPSWGTTQILLAEIAVIERGPQSPAAVRALAASYRAEPFRRQEALWRLACASAAWLALQPATREAALAEADWLVRIDGGLAPQVARALGDSPAGFAFALRHSRHAS